MDSTVEEIIRANPEIFNLNNGGSAMQVSTNPTEIHNAVSDPNNVYVAIEEDTAPQIQVVETHTNSELSDNDFDEILNDVGFDSTAPATVVMDNPVEISDEDLEGLEGEEEREENSNIEDSFLPELETPVTPPLETLKTQKEEEQEKQEKGPEIKYLSIPENSKSLLVDDSTSRFSGASWYEAIKEASIILAGIGGIGSNLAYQLARMHPKTLLLYDDDLVESANMSGQLFSKDDIGLAKVDAMAHMINLYTSANNIFAIRDKFTCFSPAGDIMICGFDNMKARKTFFESWKKHVLNKPEEERYKCLYLDGRLSIDTLQVFCITGDDFCYMKEYEEDYLFSDEEADETICSLKQTTYMACMIASMMTNLFTNFIANTLHPVLPFDLPFFVEYDAQNLIFKMKA